MNTSTKYAILIGINDYVQDAASTIKLNPLSGCVKDIQNMKNILYTKCGFEKENIHSIESSNVSHQSEIYATLLNTLNKIKETFNPEIDSIFFQFSGHGVLHDDKSFIMLHNTPLPVLSIPETIFETLNPKYQFIIFDCCHCGEIMRTRSTENNLEKYFKASTGIDILYACKQSQTAKECDEGGFLTNTVIEIISDLKYYDDDILSSGKLIDLVKREIILKNQQKNRNQDPVGSTQSSGYYPFATKEFWIKEIEESSETTSIKDDFDNTRNVIQKQNIYADENFHKKRNTMNNFFFEKAIQQLEIIMNNLNSSDIDISDTLVETIYKKLKFKPLSTSINRLIVPPKRSLLDFGLFKNTTEYEYILDINAPYKIKKYAITNSFLNIFNIGVIILNLPFGIVVTFISRSNKFGESNYSTELNNFYFEIISEENLNKKEANINTFFKEQFLKILEKQNFASASIESSLLEELSCFQESTTVL